MPTEISIIGFPETTITLVKKRLESGPKQDLIKKLVGKIPPKGKCDISTLSDQLGSIIDKDTTTTIQSRGRVFVGIKSRLTQNNELILQTGQEAKICLTGYGQPLPEKAVICVRNKISQI